MTAHAFLGEPPMSDPFHCWNSYACVDKNKNKVGGKKKNLICLGRTLHTTFSLERDKISSGWC